MEHHDVSPGNSIIVRSTDGTATGYLIDGTPSTRRVYERTGIHSGSSMHGTHLFVAQPPVRTVGDDLESFTLIFLWLVAMQLNSFRLPTPIETPQTRPDPWIQLPVY
ncbi:hypothetical protein BDP27DRAFT_1434112 [Rhodocollybia butyracea]|uniref:Protein kinase domain-containing protein n=1 Tax=Rhodocollybia butyracea TaxID=206335 RepID=A0A9P5P3U5_9AGAR|nr:hypothetical protein BDP27DRAFT_1434112 [Rhodocollybia butyracea]